VLHEISYSHLPRKDKRYGSREQSQKQEQPAKEFQHASHPKQREHGRRATRQSARYAKEFLASMRHVKKRCDYSQYAEHDRRPFGEIYSSHSNSSSHGNIDFLSAAYFETGAMMFNRAAAR
jgi:hypothetical protein